MKMPVFVSHYTENSPYEKIVKDLEASLKKFELPYYIEPIKTLGSWRLNSNYCAKLVQKCLKMFPDSPILRIDADAVVQEYPKLFESQNFNPDVAATIWYRFRKRGELLGGTLYFANTPVSIGVVDEWVALCEKSPTSRNPDLLEIVLWKNSDKVGRSWSKSQQKFSLPNNVKFEKLPLSYCKIFDLMKHEVQNPVIEHFQASRKCRKVMTPGT